MPAIWFGTVVLWKVVEQQKEKGAAYKHVKHEDIEVISIYVHDYIESEDVKPRIVKEYIKVTKKNKEEIWEAYGNGLLQVVDIEHTIVTPPDIPWDDDE